MKILTTIIIALLLSSCALFSPPKFDSNQYSLLTSIKVAAQNVECSEARLVGLQFARLDITTDELVAYSEYLPNNKEIYDIAVILDEDINQVLKRLHGEGLSSTFCKAKMDLFVKKADRAMKAMAATQ